MNAALGVVASSVAGEAIKGIVSACVRLHIFISILG